MRPMTSEQFEAFYRAEYPRLVKILVVKHGATIEEAEDAAQEAMADLDRRRRAGQLFSNPAAFVRTAAARYFFKARKRERQRLPREQKATYAGPDGCFDEQLRAWEEKEYVEQELARLTPTQRAVLTMIMDGASTHEIAQKLGKTDENIRQHAKNGRNSLKRHLQLTPTDATTTTPSGPNPLLEVRSTATTPEPRKEEVQ